MTPPHPVDLRRMLGPLRRGPSDPAMRIGADGVWRATRTPEGPATMLIRARASRGEVTMRAGSGRGVGDRSLPRLVGAEDTGTVSPPATLLVDEWLRRFPGMRSGAARRRPRRSCRRPSSRRSSASRPTLLRPAGAGPRRAAPGPAPPGLRVHRHRSALRPRRRTSSTASGVERKRADTIRIWPARAPPGWRRRFAPGRGRPPPAPHRPSGRRVSGRRPRWRSWPWATRTR